MSRYTPIAEPLAFPKGPTLLPDGDLAIVEFGGGHPRTGRRPHQPKGARVERLATDDAYTTNICSRSADLRGPASPLRRREAGDPRGAVRSGAGRRLSRAAIALQEA